MLYVVLTMPTLNKAYLLFISITTMTLQNLQQYGCQTGNKNGKNVR